MDIELPNQAEMLTRVHSNKTIGRVYDQATPM